MEQIFFFGLFAAVLTGFAFLRWKAGVKLFFLLVILDGAIRKWIFPEAQQFLYFLKDFLLVGVYLRLMLSTGHSVIPEARSWVGLNILLGLIVTVQALNPELPSIVLGLIGWKSYLLYVPLVFVVPYLFDSIDEVLHALRRYSLVALPVVMVGGMQFFSGSESTLNAGLLNPSGMVSEQAVFHEVDRVRVAGPFPFVTGFTAYLSAILVCVLVLLIHGDKHSRSTRWGAYIVGSACAIGMLMSGSRAPVITGIAMVVLCVVLSLKLGIIRERQSWVLGVAVLMVIGTILWLLPDALEAWTGRITELQIETDPIFGRIVSEFTELWRVVQEVEFFGSGAGATHNAAVSLIDVPGGRWSWLPTIAEGEMSRVMLELGIVGWLVVYGARIWIIFILWNEATKAADPAASAVLPVVCAFLIVQLPAQIMTNPVANAYYYGAIGVAFAVIKIARQRIAVAGSRASLSAHWSAR